MKFDFRRKQHLMLAAATLLAAGMASAQPSLTEPNNSAGSTMDTPPLVQPPSIGKFDLPSAGTTTRETPSRTESPLWAFDKLDPTHRGYVTQGDVAQLPGHYSFDQADMNHDGKLDASEFQRFWSGYQSGASD